MSSDVLADYPKSLRNGQLYLEMKPETGSLQILAWKGGPILEFPSLPDFCVEIGKDKLDAGFSLTSVTTSDVGVSSRLVATYQTATWPGLSLIQEVGAGVRPHSILRTFQLRTSPDFPGYETASVHSLKITLSGIGGNKWSEARVSVPMARFRPERLLSEVVQRSRHIPFSKIADEFEDLGVAPDCGLGAVLLSAPDSDLHFAAIPLAQESPVRTFVFGHAGRMAIEQSFATELKLEPGQTYPLGGQVLLFAEGERRQMLERVSSIYSGHYPPSPDRPEWASNATIFEADLVHYGGIAQLTAKLPAIKAQGFDTVYLMPWHAGPFSGYGTLDYWQIDPAKGTFEDLKALTSRVHELGLKILFDLLVNMVMDESPYLKRHSDWFYHDAGGQPLRHAVWPGFALDPASPGYRAFLRDYCVRCVREFGADGFRVDAVAYRGGNWNPLPGLQPRQHAHAVFSLLAEIRADIKKVSPTAILMAECFGPAQVPCSDLVCFQWVGWLDWVLERLVLGKLSGKEVSALLRDHFGCMPADTWLTTYSHTHDTVAFQGRDWDGLPAQTLFVTLSAISSASMTFGGGWDMRERPSEKETGLYQDLASLRFQWGGVASNEVSFVNASHPSLLVAERSSSIGRLRISSNFSSTESPWKPKGSLVFSARRSTPGKLKPWDVVIENVS